MGDWADVATMQSDPLYNPSCTTFSFAVGATGSDVQFNGAINDLVYLELSNMGQTGGTCALTGTGIDNSDASVLGTTDPYTGDNDGAGEYSCGALVQFADSTELAYEDTFILTLGDGTDSNSITITINSAIEFWADPTALQADSVYDAATVELDTDVGATTADSTFEAYSGSFVHLLASGFTDGDGKPGVISPAIDDGSVTLIGLIGPYIDSGYYYVDAYFQVGNGFAEGDQISFMLHNNEDGALSGSVAQQAKISSALATITIQSPPAEWSDVSDMEESGMYTMLSTVAGDPIDFTFDAADDPPTFETEASTSIYLTITGLADLLGTCAMTGTGVDNSEVVIHGTIGPWEDDDTEENTCGVLFTVDSASLVDEDATDVSLTFGDGADDVVVTLTYPVEQPFETQEWADLITAQASDEWAAVDFETESINAGETGALGVALDVEGSVYIVASALHEDASACTFELDADSVDKALIVGIVGPFTDSDDESHCGVLLTLTADAEAEDEVEGTFADDVDGLEPELETSVTITVNAPVEEEEEEEEEEEAEEEEDEEEVALGPIGRIRASINSAASIVGFFYISFAPAFWVGFSVYRWFFF